MQFHTDDTIVEKMQNYIDEPSTSSIGIIRALTTYAQFAQSFGAVKYIDYIYAVG